MPLQRTVARSQVLLYLERGLANKWALDPRAVQCATFPSVAETDTGAAFVSVSTPGGAALGTLLVDYYSGGVFSTDPNTFEEVARRIAETCAAPIPAEGLMAKLRNSAQLLREEAVYFPPPGPWARDGRDARGVLAFVAAEKPTGGVIIGMERHIPPATPRVAWQYASLRCDDGVYVRVLSSRGAALLFVEERSAWLTPEEQRALAEARDPSEVRALAELAFRVQMTRDALARTSISRRAMAWLEGRE